MQTCIHDKLEELPEEPKGATPETDKAEIRFVISTGATSTTGMPLDGVWTHADFSRRLETQRDALLRAAQQLKIDMQLRAKIKSQMTGDPITIEASDGIWEKFCNAIDAVESGKVPHGD